MVCAKVPNATSNLKVQWRGDAVVIIFLQRVVGTSLNSASGWYQLRFAAGCNTREKGFSLHTAANGPRPKNTPLDDCLNA